MPRWPRQQSPVRIALGFHAGGSLPLRLAPDKLDDLRRMLTRARPGSRRSRPIDGPCSSNLAQVIYLRIESDEHRVGF